MPQYRELVLDRLQEHLGAQVFSVLRRDQNPPAAGRMIDHVQHQAHEAIDKVFPGARFPCDAAVEQIAVDVGKGHDEILKTGIRRYQTPSCRTLSWPVPASSGSATCYPHFMTC